MKEFEKEYLRLYKIDEGKALDYIEEYGANHPLDNEVKFFTAFCFRSADAEASLEILNEILKTSPLDVKTVLLKAFIEDTYRGQVSDNTLLDINKCIQCCGDSFYLRQLYLLNAFYYRSEDRLKYLEGLRISIEKDPDASYNYYLLGLEINSMNLLEKSIANIQKIYSRLDFADYNPISFDELCNELIRGVYITQANYESMIEKIQEAKDKQAN